ncbi:MAG: HAMP domain-containing histidine kinase [Myxococcales bacterium]|nr:HAMP domain-containing histidine kinase [Myxococcales bacterium]
MRRARPPRREEISNPRIERLLRQREAKGLMVSSIARLVFLVVGALVTLANAATTFDLACTGGLLVLGVVVCAFTIRVCTREEKQLDELLLGGRLSVAYDALLIVVMPIIWYTSLGGAAKVSPAFLLRNEIIAVAMIPLVINTLAMRPLYPLVIAYVTVSCLVGYVIYGWGDPRLTWTNDNVEAVLGSGIKLGFFLWRIIAVLLAGHLLVRLAWWARHTIRDVVELEDATQSMMEKQAQAVHDAKMGALSNLVAGMAHELNTPVGALVSASDVASSSARKLRERLDRIFSGEEAAPARVADDRKLSRLVEGIVQTEQATRQAADRMKTVIDSLSGFARLDASERAPVDLAAQLEAAVAMVDARKRAGVELRLELEPLPPREVNVAAFNQVYLTLLENAFDALSGMGTLTLRSRRDSDGGDCIEIIDDGPGIASERLEQLFDLALAAKQGRVGMGLGLPTARRAVEQHGGKLSVDSTPGKGATFSIRLPAV